MEIPTHDLIAWQRGEFVQKAFPYLTPAEREFFFMSHICGECWDNLFTYEDES